MLLGVEAVSDVSHPLAVGRRYDDAGLDYGAKALHRPLERARTERRRSSGPHPPQRSFSSSRPVAEETIIVKPTHEDLADNDLIKRLT